MAGRRGWAGRDGQARARKRALCVLQFEFPMMPTGTDISNCLLSWLEQNDGAVVESEAGGVTPSLEECVHVANERQRKQNTGIVFCKSQIHVLLPFSFSPKLKIGHKKKRKRKARATGGPRKCIPHCPLPAPVAPWVGPEARHWFGSGFIFIVLLWKSPYPARSVCGLLSAVSWAGYA